MNPELDQLLAGLFGEPGLDDEARARLAAILRAEPAARRRYLDHVQMHSLLAHEHGLLAAFVPDEEFLLAAPGSVPGPKASSVLRLAVAAVVAFGLFLTAALVLGGSRDRDTTEAVALQPAPVLPAPVIASSGSQNRPPTRTVSAIEKLSFNRDVRPILSDHCFQCHGPDAAARKADLRLDQEEHVFSDAHDPPLITRFRPDESALFYRISTADEDDIMPPPDAHKPMDAGDVSIVRRWIEEGATWQEHWAFEAPKKAGLPAVRNPAWPRNPIDHFILAELERNNLGASHEADAPTLVRRLHLDLTGLPPGPDEIARFLTAFQQDAQSAMEQEVDRLLAKPAYGEHRARYWLDAARYADTHGLHLDNYREIWPYRDWVVEAFNQNMPFDQFTVEQLAGDLLPGATLSQQVATGFNRCNVTTSEGGAIPEEFAVRYAIDRVETTSAVWLGLTTGCAACHDHKFDPVSQKEFYQLLAYFNNTTQAPMDGNVNDTAPVVTVLPPQQKAELDALVAREQDLVNALPPGEATSIIPPENTFSESAGRESFDPAAPFSIVVWTDPTAPKSDLVRKTEKVGSEYDRGLIFQLSDGELHIEFLNYGRNNNLVLKSGKVVGAHRPYHVVLTSTGKVRPGAIRAFVDGVPVELRTEKNALYGTVANAGETHAAEGSKFFAQALVPSEILALSLAGFPATADIRAGGPPTAALAAAAERSTLMASPQVVELDQVVRRRSQLESAAAVTHVMAERPDTKPVAHVLERGEYDQRREEVGPAVPEVLPQPSDDAPANRLGLARWIVDPSNPLTARVTVNRLWQQIFGQGFVATADDFGLQGEPPSHPELLDFLAVDFIDSGWDVKRFFRQIVLSATYRQSAHLTPGLAAADPKNRLLGRAPRTRLDAEVIRDQALAAAGLLDRRLGGPGVHPYQPSGIWEAVGYSGSNTVSFTQDAGSALYRRSLYTFWKRTAPPPSMTLFDAPNRESCSVRRERTNTPLQALVLMNDPQFVEAARALAEYALLENPADPIAAMHLRVLAKPPRPADAKVFQDSLETFETHFAENPEAARGLIHTGDSSPSEEVDPSALAAHTLVASQILNLDESINRN